MNDFGEMFYGSDVAGAVGDLKNWVLTGSAVIVPDDDGDGSFFDDDDGDGSFFDDDGSLDFCGSCLVCPFHPFCLTRRRLQSSPGALDMQRMFASALSLPNGLGTWDTSNVGNMNSMFAGATGFDDFDISGWNVQRVTSARSM